MAEPAMKKPKFILGVRYEERKNNPPPGLVWRKVKDKETLGSIADEYNIRAIDLMLYNWHTVNPQEVNWYLKNFMGCKNHNGKWYSFAWADSPGQILVPNIPPALKNGPPKSVNVTRNGKATFDNKLQVHVVEWLASGLWVDVENQWLYVFSGQGGIDFGTAPPPPILGKDAPPGGQPGTAFTLDFPGVFHIKERPDKLEYEIYISGKNEPSKRELGTVRGLDKQPKPQDKLGGFWHFLSDPQILAKATTESRHQRTSHAFRNTKAVTIDLSQNRRYYFLLSPVQLGPEALKYAMANPKGLTPLLKPGDNKRVWDPTNGSNPYKPDLKGPTADDIKTGTFTLPVINPYSWAENIAEVVYPDALKQYVEWTGSKQNLTVEKLKKETGWPSLDHFYLAQVLDSVIDNYPKKQKILDKLDDWRKWHDNLGKWEQELIERNAEIAAAAHRSLLQLLEWLDGPGHTIIDTAILLDTNPKNPEDGYDLAHGIFHWAFCLENLMTLEPGGVYLKEVLTGKDTVPAKMVFRPFDNAGQTLLPQLQQIAFHKAYPGVMKLLALRNFVTPPPAAQNLTRSEYMKKLVEENQKRRDQVIKVLNDNKILPVPVVPLSLPNLQNGGVDVKLWAPIAYGSLDFLDKSTTYIIDKNINFDKNSTSRFIRRMARIEAWFDRRPDWFRLGANYGTNFGAKGFGFVVSLYNLITTVTTARYDYQKEQSTVSTMDYFNVSAGAAIAVREVLETVGTYIEKKHIGRIFPELTKPGDKFVVPGQLTGIASRVFAGIHVAAMFTVGVTTMISMANSGRQARNRGDYTASAFYLIGSYGGFAMAAGSIALGAAIFKVGGLAAAAASVGVVLFMVGGIIVAIAALLAWIFSSDDYEIFARNCFFGEHGHHEPRFGTDPPDWSHALKSGANTWPVEKQRRAIHNLLGKFTVRTRLDKRNDYSGRYENSEIGRHALAIEIDPGLLIEGCTFEIALHYGKNGQQTSKKFQWWGENKVSWVPGIKGDLFTIEAGDTVSMLRGRQKTITAFLDHLKYETKKGELLVTVTLTYPDLSNTIRCRKLALEPDGSSHTIVDREVVTSALYE